MDEELSSNGETLDDVDEHITDFLFKHGYTWDQMESTLQSDPGLRNTYEKVWFEQFDRLGVKHGTSKTNQPRSILVSKFNSLHIQQKYDLFLKLGFSTSELLDVDLDRSINMLLSKPEWASKIENILENPIELTLNMISGPSSWSMYLYEGRKIHIFGDLHGEENLCPECTKPTCTTIIDLADYISERALREKRYVNFFLEEGYTHNAATQKEREFEPIPGTLVEFNNYFRPCLDIDKTRCPYYPYGKFHYTDIRGRGYVKIEGRIRDGLEGRMGSEVFNNFKRILERDPYILFNAYVKDDDAYSSFKLLDAEYDIEKAIFKSGTRMHKVRWELMNTDPVIAQKIETYFKPIYLKYITWWLQLQIDLFRPDRLYFATVKIFGLFVDIYLLCRLFRSMSWDKDSSLFIIFMGDAHAENYRGFFKEMLGISPSQDSILLDHNKERSGYMNSDAKIHQCIVNPDFHTIFGKDLW